MAHNIQEHDKQQGVVQAWHGLTEIVQDINLDDCFLAKWDIVPVPLYTFDDKGEKVDSGFQIFQCNDNSLQVGQPFKDSYYPIDNSHFLSIVRDSLAGTNHKIVSLGSVRNRGRIFVSIELKQLEAFEVDGKKFDNFLNFGTSHDQSCQFYWNTSNICTVCDNTFTANLHGKFAVGAKIKHRPNAGEKLDNLPQIIDAAIGVQAEFKSALESIKEMSVEPVTAMEVFTGFETPLTAKKDEALSTRTTNKVDRLMQLFRTEAVGNHGQSRLDMFQAVTDFYSHESSGGDNKWKQFVSSEFGTGAARKQNFLKVVSDNERFAKIQERGKAVRQATKDKLQLV